MFLGLLHFDAGRGLGDGVWHPWEIAAEKELVTSLRSHSQTAAKPVTGAGSPPASPQTVRIDVYGIRADSTLPGKENKCIRMHA